MIMMDIREDYLYRLLGDDQMWGGIICHKVVQKTPNDYGYFSIDILYAPGEEAVGLGLMVVSEKSVIAMSDVVEIGHKDDHPEYYL